MEGRGVAQRTGGRSARVRDAVHQAVTDLIAQRGEDAVTMAEVAERSGVHFTSLYRRWGTRDALVLDVAVSRLNTELPMPDTGSLHADLVSYAQAVAANIARPDGLAFLRAVIATANAADAARDDRDFETGFLAGRGAQIQTMLDRAATRGEPALHYTAVLDGIVAPIYMRHLFRVGGVDNAYLTVLVHQILTLAAGKMPPPSAASPLRPAGLTKTVPT